MNTLTVNSNIAPSLYITYFTECSNIAPFLLVASTETVLRASGSLIHSIKLFFVHLAGVITGYMLPYFKGNLISTQLAITKAAGCPAML